MQTAARREELLPAASAPAPLAARIVGRGETFAIIAQDLFGDPQAAALLRDLNPAAQLNGVHLCEGQALRVPGQAAAQRWLSDRCLGLGFEVGAVGGSTPCPSWRAFVSPAPRLSPAPDLMAAYLRSSDLVDMVTVVDEEELGAMTWERLQAHDQQAASRLLGARSAAAAEMLCPDRTVRGALAAAARYRVEDRLTQTGRDLLRRAAEVFTASARRPERSARLLLALPRLSRSQAEQLLRGLGLDADEVASSLVRLSDRGAVLGSLKRAGREPHAAGRLLESRALGAGIDLGSAPWAGLLRRLPRSAAARDRLAIALLGLEQARKRLQQALPTLAKACRSAAEQLQQHASVAYLAAKLPSIVAQARTLLQIQHQDSLAAGALQQIVSSASGSASTLLRGLVGLLATVADKLLDAGVETLERGLAAVLGHGRAGKEGQSLRVCEAHLQERAIVGQLEMSASLASVRGWRGRLSLAT